MAGGYIERFSHKSRKVKKVDNKLVQLCKYGSNYIIHTYIQPQLLNDANKKLNQSVGQGRQ